jgi:small-conductance mechanosensitive channel
MPTGLEQPDVRALAGHLEATAVTLVAAFVVWRISLFVIARFFERRFMTQYVPRVATFCALSKSICGLVILLAAFLELLNIWAVNVTPAVWTAGIITAALAFGSQTVVRDIITGFFFLFEDQYDVGDRVELVTSTGQILSGTIDSMGLRTTKVVDGQGRFVVVPNGNIALVTNASRLPTKVGFTIAVPWRDDATVMNDRILSYVREAGKAAGMPADAFRVALVDSTLDAAVFRIEIQSRNAESDLIDAKLRERLVARLQADGWLPGIARPQDNREEKEIS